MLHAHIRSPPEVGSSSASTSGSTSGTSSGGSTFSSRHTGSLEGAKGRRRREKVFEARMSSIEVPDFVAPV